MSILIYIIGCNNEERKTRYYFPQIGWALDVPEMFEVLDSTEMETLNNEGKSSFEKSTGNTLDFSSTKNLISIKKGELNYLRAGITPYPHDYKEWLESYANVKSDLVRSFQTITSELKIDSSSSIEVHDGIEFDKFDLKLTFSDNRIMNIILYSKLFKGYDFGVAIFYADENILVRNLKIYFLEAV